MTIERGDVVICESRVVWYRDMKLMFGRIRRSLSTFRWTKTGKPCPAADQVSKASYLERHTECAYRDFTLGGWHDLRSGDLAPGVPVDANDTVLDVGCGGAGHSQFCLLRGANVVFTDIDPQVIERASAVLSAIGPGTARGIVSDSYPIPVESESFSKIIAAEVLEHVDDAEEFLRELYRAGKPGAQYLITVPHAVSEQMQSGIAPSSYFRKPNHVRILNKEIFESLVLGAGLEIERYESNGAYWTLWWLFFWNAGVDLSSPDSPLLEAWTTTWSELLNTPHALRVKKALDEYIPKSQVIVARKPGKSL